MRALVLIVGCKSHGPLNTHKTLGSRIGEL